MVNNIQEILYNGISVDTIITLYNMLDVYEDFNKDLKNLLTSKENDGYVGYNLWRLSTYKDETVSKKIKKFYGKHKSVIDMVNKNSNIRDFMNDNFVNDTGRNNTNINNLFNYLMKNKEKKENIFLVLDKIKKLGFDKIYFDEKFDFTKKEYIIFTNFIDNYSLNYLDNIEIIPNYSTGHVKYRTNNSNYNMFLQLSDKDISQYGREILLNSLLFDVRLLPDSIEKETTFDMILDIKKREKNKCDILRDSIDLSVNLDYLYEEFNNTCTIVKKLNMDDKSKLIEELSSIKKSLKKMKTISNEFNKKITSEDFSITEKRLNLEKKDYLFMNSDNIESI